MTRFDRAAAVAAGVAAGVVAALVLAAVVLATRLPDTAPPPDGGCPALPTVTART